MKAIHRIVSVLLMLVLVSSLTVQGLAVSVTGEQEDSDAFVRALADGMLDGGDAGQPNPNEKIARGAAVYALCRSLNGFEPEVTEDTGVITVPSAQLREEPGIDKDTAFTLPRGTRVTVAGYEAGWYSVRIDGAEGYVFEDDLTAAPYLDLDMDTYYSDSVVWAFQNGLLDPSEDFFRPDDLITGGELKDLISRYAVYAGIIRQGQSLYSQGPEDDGSVSVREAGSLLQDFTQRYAPWLELKANELERERGGSLRLEIVEYAESLLGRPYVYGAAGPDAFDCSGFIMYVYAHFGVDLYHGVSAQYAASTHVSKSELLPGDIIILSGTEHIGMYCGDGMVIHASSSQRCIVKVPLDGAYISSAYSGAGRFV